jgi:hypothetical protein
MDDIGLRRSQSLIIPDLDTRALSGAGAAALLILTAGIVTITQ